MRILESSEDYLEAMLMMKEQHGYIRSIDIAVELGVTKPSVSYATKRLRENGYITMDKEGLITLTDKGMEVATRIYERHKTLTTTSLWRWSKRSGMTSEAIPCSSVTRRATKSLCRIQTVCLCLEKREKVSAPCHMSKR